MSNEAFNIVSGYNDLFLKPLLISINGHEGRKGDENDVLFKLYSVKGNEWSEAFGILEFLRNDLHAIKMLGDKELAKSDEYSRFRTRLYICSTFMLVEACLTFMVNLIRAKDGWQGLITKKANKYLDPNVRGMLVERTNHILKSFSVVFDLDIDIEQNNSWNSYKKATELRKFVTHPQSYQDLIIDTDRAIEFKEGWDWFAREAAIVLSAYTSKCGR